MLSGRHGAVRLLSLVESAEQTVRMPFLLPGCAPLRSFVFMSSILDACQTVDWQQTSESRTRIGIAYPGFIAVRVDRPEQG